MYRALYCSQGQPKSPALRSRGHRHHGAVRSLAFKWNRILFRSWKNRQPEGEARYLKQLQAKGAIYLKSLQPT